MMMHRRIAFGIGIALVGITGILYVVSSIILLNSFSKVEEQSTRRNLQRVLQIISDHLDELSKGAADYAIWDETYTFAQGNNPGYLEENVSDITFTSSNADLVIITNAAGKVLYGRGYDKIYQHYLPLPAQIRRDLTPTSPLVGLTDPNSEEQGFLNLSNRLLLVASRPIVNNEGQGPVAGVMIYGRYLNADRIAQLSHVMRLEVSIQALSDPALPADFKTAYQALTQKKSIFVQPLDHQTVAGYTILKDVYGKPIFLLRISTPRTVYGQGLLSLRYMGLSMLILGSLFGLIIWLLLRKLLQSLTERDRIAQKLEQEAALRQSELRYREKAAELEQALQDLQAAQLKLLQSEKMSSLGQLVAGVAHEINNPISFIYGNISHARQYTQSLLSLVSLYQQHYPEPVGAIQTELNQLDLEFLAEDLSKLLTSMRVGSERIRKIVLSLRNFSRMDESEMKLADIHEGLESTLLILHSRLNQETSHAQTTIIRDYGELPLVECYPGLLNQVFMNLLNNAIDALEDMQAIATPHLAHAVATPSLSAERHEHAAAPTSGGLLITPMQPYIRIRTELTADQQILIRISNNGPPIPESIQHRLFDPFFTTKEVGKGTGLGLTICYQIVIEKHKGQLYCISQPEQETEFTVQIPIQQRRQHKENL